MTDPATHAKHFKVIRGMCLFLFVLTLLFLELSFVGLADAEEKTRSFRKAIPRTVLAPMGTGVLLGHWFHPGRYSGTVFNKIEGVNLAGWVGPLIIAIVAVIFVALGMGFYLADSVDFYFPGWTMALLGMVLGALFWATEPDLE